MEMGHKCLVMVGQLNPGVRVLGFITMPRKKQDDGDDGPGPEPISLNSKLWHSFLLPWIVLSFNIDVGVMQTR